MGVTSSDPHTFEHAPEFSFATPDSEVMSWSQFFRGGDSIHSCPVMILAPGDIVGIAHRTDTVYVYHNGKVHHHWTTQLQGRLWGCIGLGHVTQVTVIGTGLLPYLFIYLLSFI